jgi:hypothetical protein
MPWRRRGEKRYNSYSFLTSALDGGEWLESCSGHALALGKRPPVSIVQEAGRASGLVWTQRLEEKSFCLIEWLTLLLHIWEILSSNLGPETGYPDLRFFVVFLSPSKQMPE